MDWMVPMIPSPRCCAVLAVAAFAACGGTETDRTSNPSLVLLPDSGLMPVDSAYVSPPNAHGPAPDKPKTTQHATTGVGSFHNPQPAAFKIYDNPVPKENLVHSMEHGGVIVWYNTENQDVINQVKAVVSSELKRQKEVVMSKYTDMEPDTIAMTAWTRLEKIPVSEFTSNPSKAKDDVKTFIEKLSKHFNPEGF